MKFLLMIFILLLFSNCEKRKNGIVENNDLLKNYYTKEDTVKVGPEAPYVTNPINLSTLTEISYKEAQILCGIPPYEGHFVLNEKPLTSLRKFLVKNFTKTELKLPLTIKEVKWDNKKDDYIFVFYQVKDSLWQPIQAIEFRKSSPLDDSNFANITPKEE